MRVFIEDIGKAVTFEDGLSQEEMERIAREEIIPQWEASQIGPTAPTEQDLATQRAGNEERAGYLPSAIRAGGGIAGAIAGAVSPIPGGAALGGMTGSAIGDYLAQQVEIGRGAREEYNPARTAVEGVAGLADSLIPGARAGAPLLTQAARFAGSGAVLATTEQALTDLVEYGEINARNLGVAAVTGGTLAAGLGTASAAYANRALNREIADATRATEVLDAYQQFARKNQSPVVPPLPLPSGEVAPPPSATSTLLQQAQESQIGYGRSIARPQPIVITPRMDDVAGGRDASLLLEEFPAVAAREPLRNGGIVPESSLPIVGQPSQQTTPTPVLTPAQAIQESARLQSASPWGLTVGPQDRTLHQRLVAIGYDQATADTLTRAQLRGESPPIPHLAIKPEDTLTDFISKWGGLPGEATGLTQADIRPMVSPQGRSLYQLADLAFQAGYINAPDQVKLVNEMARDMAAAAQGQPRVVTYSQIARQVGQLSQPENPGFTFYQDEGKRAMMGQGVPFEAAEVDPMSFAVPARSEAQLPPAVRGKFNPAQFRDLEDTKGFLEEHGFLSTGTFQGDLSFLEKLHKQIGDDPAALERLFKDEAGSTTLFTEAPLKAAQKLGEWIRAGQGVVTGPGVKDLAKYRIASWFNRVKTVGADIDTAVGPDGVTYKYKVTAGVVDKIMRHVQKTETDAGRYTTEMQILRKQLSKEEAPRVIQALRGQIREDTLSPRELTAYTSYRGYLNEFRAWARRLGREGEWLITKYDPEHGTIYRKPFEGFENNYFPMFVKPGVFTPGHKLHREQLVHLVKTGQAANVEEAALKLKQDGLVHRGDAVKFGSLDRSRGSLELTDSAYWLDLQALEHYSERASYRLNWIDLMGPNNEKVDGIIAHAATLDEDAAAVAKQLYEAYGGLDQKDPAENLFYRGASALMAVLHLGPNTSISQLSQMLVGSPYRTSMRATAMALKDLKWSTREAGWAGQLLRTSRIQNYREIYNRDITKVSPAEAYLQLVGQVKMDNLARIVSSGAGHIYAHDLTQQLVKGVKGKKAEWIRHRLEGLNVDVERATRLLTEHTANNTPLSPEYLAEMTKAAQKASSDINFRSNVGELPTFMSKPLGRLVTIFQSFMFQNTKSLRDHVGREALWGLQSGGTNALRGMAPLATLVTAGMLGGELIADLKALATGGAGAAMVAAQGGTAEQAQAAFNAPTIPRGALLEAYMTGERPTFSGVIRNYIQASALGLFEDVWQVASGKQVFGQVTSHLMGAALTDLATITEAAKRAYDRGGDMTPVRNVLTRRMLPGGSVSTGGYRAAQRATTPLTPADRRALIERKREQKLKELFPEKAEKEAARRRETIRRRRAGGFYD